MTADSNPSSTLSSIKSTADALVKPGETELVRWRRTFDKFATIEEAGKKFLNESEFIDAIAPTDEGFNRINREQYGVLFRVAANRATNLVSFEDFVVFETLLKRPDADYQLAFSVFDVDDSGAIDFEEFKSVLQENIASSGIPFNFDCDWIKLYLGKRGTKHVLGYSEFTQLIKGFQGERLRQSFHYFDKDGDGYINPDEFQRIIIELAGHKLSDSVLQRLPTLTTMNPGRKISYSEVIAFHNVIRDMDTVEALITRAVRKSKDGRIDVSDFLNEAASSMRYSQFTPMEANIIWHFASRGEAGHGAGQRLTLNDFQSLLDAKWQPPTASPVEAAQKRGFLAELGQSTWNFVQGGIAGGIGAFAVYPIDLVKTRLQNQRSTVVGEVLYRNWLDCVKKVYANEGGVRAFYRGVLPQLVGVAPEKAIKITVNELVRKKATDPETGRISLAWELIAGGAAGGCQVSVTNPLEIVKIRLQMAGEMARADPGNAAPRGALHVIKQLGIFGLYKGAVACLWRDVPFSMIYFTAYAHLKKDIFSEGHRGKQLSFGELLLAAGIAGMPAAYLTTPADVIKTRLQSQQRAGQTVYKGFFDGFRKILQEEGVKALYKGGIARVIRSSPQFGVTLAVYEVLHKKFPYPYAAETAVVTGARPTRASHTDISRIRARNGLRILLDCSSQFGMVSPEAASKRVQSLPKALRA
ncbi:mitochondrial aspartate-glutamate transporter agc1 [Vanrija albida]|uniref:Mitochondrial aspartate-glutamate transporter agc1 n=1 Tax=Vanrija albida TaxID=181172 RepID=A0ABR3PZW4_9TREE